MMSLGSWRNRNRNLFIASNLEGPEGLLQDVSLHVRCAAMMPDELVRFMLIATDPNGRQRNFARLEWRSTPHDNRLTVCRDLQYMGAGRSHYHDPCLHTHLDLVAFFGAEDLPIAVPLPQEPETFCELLAIAGDLLHIENLGALSEPPWEPLSPLNI